MKRELALEFVRVTEQAAIACSQLIGRGDKNGADGLATDAMRKTLQTLDIQGTVVIGEGEMDEAPMLYIGEKVGTGHGDAVDIAVDPLEGTNLVAKDQPNAINVMAIAPAGHLLHAPDMYMDKIITGPAGVGILELDAPIADNLSRLAHAMDKKISELTVVVLDRERHQDVIQGIRRAGARVRLITDGDVSPAVSTCLAESAVDMVVGSGGAPEGVLAAAAVKALGGEMVARLKPEEPEEIDRMHAMGIHDINHLLTLDDLVKGSDVLYAATGVTSGELLRGVVRADSFYETHSMVIEGTTHTVRYVTTRHVRHV
ncbi:MAG: class II fructose-bisphosphatase [Firmicutes bacterium]|nr:class II fructose-bisphosphatase [Bacillota bacterium]